MALLCTVGEIWEKQPLRDVTTTAEHPSLESNGENHTKGWSVQTGQYSDDSTRALGSAVSSSICAYISYLETLPRITSLSTTPSFLPLQAAFAEAKVEHLTPAT